MSIRRFLSEIRSFKAEHISEYFITVSSLAPDTDLSEARPPRVGQWQTLTQRYFYCYYATYAFRRRRVGHGDSRAIHDRLKRCVLRSVNSSLYTFAIKSRYRRETNCIFNRAINFENLGIFFPRVLDYNLMPKYRIVSKNSCLSLIL